MADLRGTALAGFFGVLLGGLIVYFAGVLFNSHQSSENVIKQQVIESKLTEQNEEAYRQIKRRYDSAIDDLNDYQGQANKRLDKLESELERIEEEINRFKAEQLQ